MRAASLPSGWARRALNTRSALPARRRTRPCLRWRHIPGRGPAARRPTALRAARAGCVSSIAMPTLEDCAISFNVEARPPRVGSRMAWTCAPAASSTSAIMPFNAAQSDRIWLSNSRPSRTLMMAMPWSPMSPETRIASPGIACSGLTEMPGRRTPTPAVVDVTAVAVAALDDFGVAGDDLHARGCGGIGHVRRRLPQAAPAESLLRE